MHNIKKYEKLFHDKFTVTYQGYDTFQYSGNNSFLQIKDDGTNFLMLTYQKYTTPLYYYHECTNYIHEFMSDFKLKLEIYWKTKPTKEASMFLCDGKEVEPFELTEDIFYMFKTEKVLYDKQRH
jgi:hypothetical protein